MSNIAFEFVCEFRRSGMKALLLAVVIFLSVSAIEWREFKKMYGKHYSLKEDAKRLQIFMNTTRRVEEHNEKFLRGEVSYEMGVNHFADWFPEEKNRLLGVRPLGQHHAEKFEHPLRPSTSVPDSINWVEKGAVTSVKNQGFCGSCYAFSAVGALEGLMFRTNKTLFVDLSAQELIDCSSDFGNIGCAGGWMSNCFKYVKHHRGIDSDDSYPYTGTENLCTAEDGRITGYCTDYVNISSGDEEQLTQSVGTVGPVSIAFAVEDNFLHYKKGIYDGPCSGKLNHGMVAVGYGFDNVQQKKYWLVKNSWSTVWGENGYIRITKGINKCGIADMASYPIIKE